MDHRQAADLWKIFRSQAHLPVGVGPYPTGMLPPVPGFVPGPWPGSGPFPGVPYLPPLPPDLSRTRSIYKPPMFGPGTEFKRIVEQELGIQIPGCSACTNTLRKMNSLGVDGCRQKREELLEELRKNSQKVDWMKRLLAVPKAVQSGLALKVNWLDPLPDLLDLAIERAEQNRSTQQIQPPLRTEQTSETPVYFVSTAQLVTDVWRLIAELPPDLSAIVGVARSGLLPATLIAQALHLPLWIVRSKSEEVVPAESGWRLQETDQLEADKPVLLVDDTSMSGRSLLQAETLARRQFPKVLTAVIYRHPKSTFYPDFQVHDLGWPHLLEWNAFNSIISECSATDLDGIICQDCPSTMDDDGEKYLEFLRTAKPKYLMRRNRVPMIVTARLEKYRAETMAWLERYGVQCEELVMLPCQTLEERRQRDISAFKAEHFQRFMQRKIPLLPHIFWESDPVQAERIAWISQGLVVCPAISQIYDRRPERNP